MPVAATLYHQVTSNVTPILWVIPPILSNFVGYLPPILLVMYPPILSVIYPQFCGLFTPNRVGNLPQFLWVIYPNLWVIYPQFSGNLPQVWDSFLTPNFGNLGVNNESNNWGEVFVHCWETWDLPPIFGLVIYPQFPKLGVKNESQTWGKLPENWGKLPTQFEVNNQQNWG